MRVRNLKAPLALLVAAAVVSLVIVAGAWWLCRVNPRINFLPGHSAAQWIVYPTPPTAQGLRTVELSTEFRCSFQVESNGLPATLSLCAFKTWSVRINGVLLPGQQNPAGNWKRVAEMDVSRWLKPGTNDVSVEVSNSDGLPALWLSLTAGEFVLKTDEHWQCSLVGGTWRPAHPASTPLRINRGNPLYSPESPLPSLIGRLPVLLVFLVLASAVLAGTRWWTVHYPNRTSGRPGFLCRNPLFAGMGVLIVAWIMLWWNNAGSLLRLAGFDTAGHLAYIQYILDKHSLPLASEGWEMYQPPLYYVLSALQLGVLHLSTSEPSGMLVLRFFGMVCGLATFLMAFLSVCKLFADQPSTQFFGLLLSALLPANLYLSYYPTNETLAAALVAASVYVGLLILSDSRLRVARHAFLGMLLGAACLTKASALLACPMLFAALAWNLQAKGVRTKARCAQCLGAAVLVWVAVCGWHYWRTAAHFQNPLLGNWDPVSGFSWWQLPGYRTGSYYVHFGQWLEHPFYSAFASMGDGLYSTLWGDGFCGGQPDVNVRPPWNYDLMSAGYLLAVLPALAILVGGVIALLRFCRDPRPDSFVVLGLVGISGAAILYYSLKVPGYAASKAFYASSAFVPICVLGANGLGFLTRKIAGRAWLVWVPLLVWSFNVYTSLWVSRNAPATRLPIARVKASDGALDAALEQLSVVLRDDPRNAEAVALRARILARQSHLPEAREEAEKAVALDPEDAGAHLALGNILAQQGQLGEAIAQATRAVELAPDHPLAASRLSLWLAEAGRTAEAKSACAESLRVNPFSAEFHRRMALLCAALGEGTNASIHARLAAELKPTDLRKR